MNSGDKDNHICAMCSHIVDMLNSSTKFMFLGKTFKDLTNIFFSYKDNSIVNRKSLMYKIIGVAENENSCVLI